MYFSECIFLNVTFSIANLFKYLQEVLFQGGKKKMVMIQMLKDFGNLKKPRVVETSNNQAKELVELGVAKYTSWEEIKKEA